MFQNVHQAIDHLFRHQYGSIVAGLSARFGLQHLEFVEDAVQEALIRAMRLWGHKGIPSNPEGWLYRVAYRQLIDRLRRENKTEAWVDREELSEESLLVRTGKEIEDEQLQMIFACCNPKLAERDSLLLALKLIGGFSVAEIARALWLKEETARKSVQRARQHFRDRIPGLYIPAGKDLDRYLERVLKVIYLIFNEGYKASSGDDLIREDLCGEALRLALRLANHSYCSKAPVFALVSLMSFKASRFEARTGQEGELVVLEQQDRRRWNNELIQWGFYYFNRSSAGEEVTPYHLEAAIEFQYHIAPSHAEIDWQAILNTYQLLLNFRNDAFTRLNYLVILAKAAGAEPALTELEKLAQDLDGHHLFHAVYASFAEELGQKEVARQHLQKAAGLTKNRVEQDYLQRRLAELQSG